MVASTLRGTGRQLPFKMIHASRGKALRAEPVANLYERGDRVFHVGMGRAYRPGDQVSSRGAAPHQVEVDEYGVQTPVVASGYSPDRLDALVHCVTELALAPACAAHDDGVPRMITVIASAVTGATGFGLGIVFAVRRFPQWIAELNGQSEFGALIDKAEQIRTHSQTDCWPASPGSRPGRPRSMHPDRIPTDALSLRFLGASTQPLHQRQRLRMRGRVGLPGQPGTRPGCVNTIYASTDPSCRSRRFQPTGQLAQDHHCCPGCWARPRAANAYWSSALAEIFGHPSGWSRPVRLKPSR